MGVGPPRVVLLAVLAMIASAAVVTWIRVTREPKRSASASTWGRICSAFSDPSRATRRWAYMAPAYRRASYRQAAGGYGTIRRGGRR
jgi:hypothetical protein